MVRRHFVSAAAGALAACLFATANASSADPVEDECAGRNPAYCKKDAAAPKPTAADCEGRNPLYYKEGPALAKAAAPEEDNADNARGRAASDSRNKARNPNPNPHTDPNRRPARAAEE